MNEIRGNLDMSFRDPKYPLEGLDDLDLAPRIRNLPSTRQYKNQLAGKRRTQPPALPDEEMLSDPLSEMDSRRFTYTPARHEALWLLDSLRTFYDQQWFRDILRQIKGGKEATVYQCETHPAFPAPYMAAKVYRPRRFRSLKNDHAYREGRSQLDSDGRKINDRRMLHAMHKKTQFGMELLHTSWLAHEYRALQTLHAAGADVPEPYASGENVILMEYIGDADVAAPALTSVSLSRAEASLLLERVLDNIDKMLANHYVHGDLSAYNILYHAGQITLIDFPQAIDPDINRSAYPIFLRDVTRVCDYFSTYGLQLAPKKIAADLWTAHSYRFQPEIHPRLYGDQDGDEAEK
jgi:RIO kinase 1